MDTKNRINAMLFATTIVVGLCAIPIMWWLFVGVHTTLKSPPVCPVYTCSCDGNSATLSVEVPSEK